MTAVVEEIQPGIFVTVGRTPSLCRHKRRRPSKSRRCVRFQAHDRIHEIPGRDNLSQKDIEKLYVTKAEQRKLHCDVVKIIRKARQEGQGLRHKTIDDIRGLESLVRQEDYDRIVRLRSAVRSVIQRQLDGPIDEVWLSDIYRPFSREAILWAQRRALKDQLDAFSDAPRRMIMTR